MGFSILPSNMPRAELVQIIIFLVVFLMSILALIGTWLGSAYVVSSIVYLFIAFNSFANTSVKSLYIYAYSSFLSVITDILIISIQYGTYRLVYGNSFFFLGLIACLFLMIFKIFIGIFELQYAKTLAGEQGLPINLSSMFSTTSRPANQPQPQLQQQQQYPQQQQQQAHYPTQAVSKPSPSPQARAPPQSRPATVKTENETSQYPASQEVDDL